MQTASRSVTDNVLVSAGSHCRNHGPYDKGQPSSASDASALCLISKPRPIAVHKSMSDNDVPAIERAIQMFASALGIPLDGVKPNVKQHSTIS